MYNHLTRFLLGILLISLACISTVAAFDEQTEGRLTILSDPEGADVWVSGEFVGYTPCTAIVRGDAAVNLRIEKHGGNYQVWQGSAYVPTGEDVSFNATLYKKSETARSTGVIVVTSNVDGAEVYLDNSYMGTISGGSLNLDQIKLGLHYLVVKMDGYSTFSTMTEVDPKDVATTNVIATLTSTTTTEETPETTTAQPTSTIPPAPTKSPVCFCLPLIVIAGAVIGLRR